MREIIKRWINSSAYVIWIISLWMIKYYQLLELEFDIIRFGYLLSMWFLIIAAIILYSDSIAELNHEILKSSVILIITSILDMIYYGNGTIENLVKYFIILLLYQLWGYVVYAFIKYSKKQLGKYAQKLALLSMAGMGIVYFVFKWHIAFAFIVYVVINLNLGYRYFVKYNKELKQAQLDEEKLLEEEMEKEKEEKEIRRLIDHQKQEIEELKIKNKRLQEKNCLYETKRKRAKQRKSN